MEQANQRERRGPSSLHRYQRGAWQPSPGSLPRLTACPGEAIPGIGPEGGASLHVETFRSIKKKKNRKV